MKRIILGVSFVLAVCLAAGAASADIYIKQKQHRDAMKIMGQEEPAEDMVSEMWITEKGMRSDTPKQSMIMLPDAGKMIGINHEQKTYSEMPLNMGAMLEKEMEGAGEEERAAFKGLMDSMMKMDVKVSPNGKTRKIGKWNCQGYDMTLSMFAGTVTSEVWATEDIKIDQKLYDKYKAGSLLTMPGMQESFAAMEKEMQKLKGVQVLNISANKVMGQTVTSTTELVEYKQAKAPADIFAVPAGYKKVSHEVPDRQTPPPQEQVPSMKDVFKGLSGMGAGSEEAPASQGSGAPQQEAPALDFKSLLNKFK